MRKRRHFTVMAGLLTAAVIGSACDQPDPIALPDVGAPLFWEGCPAGKKFTGGGRIDPNGEKVTFGFNVHSDDTCNPLKGQLQVVHHPSKTKIHSTSITSFASYANPDGQGGECGEFRGTVRFKTGNGEWRENPFAVQACDSGEPGSSPGTGPDTFWFMLDGIYSTGPTPLTGGTIQAH